MEPEPSAPRAIQGPGATRYTVSLTARACLQALRLAAWIEAMVLAHRTAHPQGAGSWSWFIGRCILFTLGAHVIIGVMAQITKRRGARGGGSATQGREDAQDMPGPGMQPLFDVPAFEATAGALLFHVGSPLWLWIFT